MRNRNKQEVEDKRHENNTDEEKKAEKAEIEEIYRKFILPETASYQVQTRDTAKRRAESSMKSSDHLKLQGRSKKLH